MAYIGTKPTVGNFQICDAISVVNGQAAYTMQVGSVNVIPQSANHMIVSLNGTIQKPNSSFTVSGSTITFASNLATGDVIDFIQILGDVLDLGVPSDATVTTAKLASTSVTAAKLNNDIISGTTALTAEPADTDEFLVSDAGTLKRIDYSLIKGGGITMVDNWRLTTNFQTGDAFPVSSNLERNDTSAPAFGYYGSQMSVSSGIFTFPETGIYLVSAQSYVSATSGAISSQAINLKTTLDNSNYSSAVLSYDSSSTTNYNASFFCSTLFDVTDTSTHKVKLAVITGGTSIFDGSTSHTATGITFIRLGNT